MCLAYINMFARLDEIPAMTLQDIKETKRYGRMDALTDGGMDGQRENSIPTTNNFFFETNSFTHMLNVSTMYRQCIKLLHQKLW